jgi:alkyl sulfatase BDS1-like metallo-beta-lactamase superfamily hydrolase
MALDVVYPFDDERDFTDADRGFIAELEPGVVRNASGRGLRGGVGAGLGQTTSTGTVALIAPTVDITRTGQEPS